MAEDAYKISLIDLKEDPTSQEVTKNEKFFTEGDNSQDRIH